ncbi:MAG: hypothetical protein GC178_11505 [Flavobacteriales bacterium]|nr:hypothetical protein [Flavobacteriales bacterium]
MNLIRPILIGFFLMTLISFAACNDGCVECTGPTAPQKICKGDFQNANDYQKYVSEYEAQPDGVCQ